MPAVVPVERPYHHGALRETLIEEGLRLLDERSVDDIGLREIARNVGVSATAVYRHFPDKEALLAALAAEGLHRMAEAQRRAGEAVGGGATGFQATGRAYVTFALDNPALFRLIFGRSPTHDPMDMASDKVSEAMSLLLGNAATLAPSGTDARIFALQSWASVHGLAVLMLGGQVAPEPALIDAVLSRSLPRAADPQKS